MVNWLFVWHDTNIDQSTRCALVARRVAIGLLQLAASPWEANTLCSSNQVRLSALPRSLYCVFECNGRDLIVLARVYVCVCARHVDSRLCRIGGLPQIKLQLFYAISFM